MMNTSSTGAVNSLGDKRYAWMGRTWAVASRYDDAEREMVDSAHCMDDGEAQPLNALMHALFHGNATEIVAAEIAAPPAPIKVGEIDEVGKARAQAKIDAAAAIGVALPSTQADGLFYDLGTAVMPEAWAGERKQFEQLKTGDEVLPQVRDVIVAEGRANYDYAAWDVRMSPTTGKVGVSEAFSWTPTRRGIDGFTARAGIGKVPEHWPLDIKAAAINSLCKRFAKDRPAALLNGGQDPRVQLRVQRARGQHFATTSTSYGQFDGDLVLEALLEALPRGARVAVNYDPDMARGRVEILTLQSEQPVVGEPFKTSFTVGWDDTGSGSIWGDGGLWSARCLNLTRIWTSAGTFRIRHAGSVERLARRFKSEFARVSGIVSQFSKAFGHAAADELTNADRVEGAEFIQGIYRSLIQRDLVPVTGRREEASAKLAMQYLEDENKMGATRAGIANGITRYAHRVNQDPWARDELERAAGRLLWSPRPVKLDYLAAEAQPARA